MISPSDFSVGLLSDPWVDELLVLFIKPDGRGPALVSAPGGAHRAVGVDSEVSGQKYWPPMGSFSCPLTIASVHFEYANYEVRPVELGECNGSSNMSNRSHRMKMCR